MHTTTPPCPAGSRPPFHPRPGTSGPRGNSFANGPVVFRDWQQRALAQSQASVWDELAGKLPG